LIFAAAIYSTTNKFCAKRPTPIDPLPSASKSSTLRHPHNFSSRYLCELSVQIVSPSSSVNRNFAAGIPRIVPALSAMHLNSHVFHRSICFVPETRQIKKIRPEFAIDPRQQIDQYDCKWAVAKF